MDKDKLKKILDDHKKYLNGDAGGVKADLEGANLRGAYLRGANLEGVNLQGANLSWANLRGVDFRWANLRGADLRGASLERAYLRRVDLRGANLRGADFRWANLEGVDLRGVDLREASLEGANFARCKGISLFQFDKYLAIQYKDRIRIGCEDRPITEWVADFEQIGVDAGFKDNQIKHYGAFIKYISKVYNRD